MMRDPDSVAIVRAVLATTLAALGCDSGPGLYFATQLEADVALPI